MPAEAQEFSGLIKNIAYLYNSDLPAGATRSGESSRRTLVSWRGYFLLQTIAGDLVRARGLNLLFVSIQTTRQLRPSTTRGTHTFFSILSPSCSATVIAFLRELACIIRSLIEDPVGQVYTKITTSDPG